MTIVPIPRYYHTLCVTAFRYFRLCRISGFCPTAVNLRQPTSAKTRFYRALIIINAHIVWSGTLVDMSFKDICTNCFCIVFTVQPRNSCCNATSHYTRMQHYTPSLCAEEEMHTNLTLAYVAITSHGFELYLTFSLY